MKILKLDVITVTDEEKIQAEQDWLSSTNAVKFTNTTPARKLFKILFYLHLFVIAVLVTSLAIYGLFYVSRSNYIHPKEWYPPLFISMLCGGATGFTWQWITARNPAKAIREAFWLSPLLTSAMGILFVYIGYAASLAAGVVALLSALIQSLYGIWVSPRFEYAGRVFFMVCGIGGAKAIKRTELAVFFILVILLSLGWTMQFLKNVLQVTISRVRYMHLAGGAMMDTKVALNDTVKYLTGSVSIGSILVPFISVFRGFARATSLIGGDSGEFMFSCVSCYMGIASLLVKYGNRWGLVYVGVYNKGFVQASSDTWDIFNRVGLEELINLDLTASFCFLSAVAGGAICSLVSGIWSIVIHKNYATEISIYAFLIGYFMFRLAMSWPQACVSAYYVAYAENPQSTKFDSTIPVRLEQLYRSHA
ncbi:protein PNS1-like isoform X2 [Vigna radiata var. radiata]|uniref:Choline transporter-like protein n=1 Tax=Vigna radiata var. radiata TaxID=3916 RepID=A0A3Q0FAF7_VIGRR|nr:protein PNS1-like isoform X2 [Vigna radiata var. radiata]